MKQMSNRQLTIVNRMPVYAVLSRCLNDTTGKQIAMVANETLSPRRPGEQDMRLPDYWNRNLEHVYRATRVFSYNDTQWPLYC